METIRPAPPAPDWFSAGVGFDVNIRHFAPTSADDCTVTAHARVTNVTLIEFNVRAHDGKHLIGRNIQTRVLVSKKTFQVDRHERSVKPWAQAKQDRCFGFLAVKAWLSSSNSSH